MKDFNKLAQTITLATLAFTVQAAKESAAGILEFENGDDISALMGKYDYSVISFFTNEEWAIDLDSIMDGAKTFFDKKMADGEWPQRNVGWFRANLELHPEMAYDDSLYPDQMIYNNLGAQNRLVHYQRLHEDDKEKDEASFALIVRELTGEWFSYINCDQIQ